MMGTPGCGSICRGEADAFEAKAVDQARGTRVQVMKVGDSVGSVEVDSGFPRIVANAVALPLDKVVELSTHDPAVKNAFDFELFVVIDDLGR